MRRRNPTGAALGFFRFLFAGPPPKQQRPATPEGEDRPASAAAPTSVEQLVERLLRVGAVLIAEAGVVSAAVHRVAVDLGGRVRELGTEGFEAKVLNISETGFMAEAQGEFEVGTRIWLILPGRERANALVRWIAGTRIGAEFAEPFSLEGLEA